MTTLPREESDATSTWLSAAIESMESFARCKSLPANSAQCLAFRNHRPNDEIVPLLQFPLEDGCDFRERMVGDAERNLDRLHRAIRVKLPNDRRVGLRCAKWRLCRLSRRRAGVRHGSGFTARQVVAALDPILFVNGKNLLA